MKRIVDVHFPSIQTALVRDALKLFYRHSRRAGDEETSVDIRTVRLDKVVDD